MAAAHGMYPFPHVSRLTQADLTVNLNKSEFGHAHITLLGHIVGQGQITAVMVKVEAVTKFPVPRSKKELVCFWAWLAIIENSVGTFLL